MLGRFTQSAFRSLTYNGIRSMPQMRKFAISQTKLETIKVSHIMDREVMAITVSVDDDLQTITEQFNKFNISSALVIDGKTDKIAGIITERDIVRALQRNAELTINLKASQVAYRGEIKYVTPEDKLDTAAVTMLKHGIRHIPVMYDGEDPTIPSSLAGVLSIRDILYVHYIDEITSDNRK